MADERVAQMLMERYGFNVGKVCYMMTSGDYMTPPTGFTIRDVENHLDGGATICVFAKPQMTKFICFDVDTKDSGIVHSIIDTMVGMGIPERNIYVSTSGGKGYHIDLFFSHEIFNKEAEQFFWNVVHFAGAGKNVEFKQDGRNSIKIPLGINHKTGKRCWYVDRETLEPIERFDYILETAETDNLLIRDINREYTKRRKNEMLANRPKYDPAKAEMHIAGHDPVLTTTGQRHYKMRDHGLFLRSCGANEQEVYDGMLKWCASQPAEYITSGWREIERDARNTAEWIVKKHPEAGWKREYISVLTRIDADDVRCILSMRNKFERRVGMLIWAYCKAKGICDASYNRIARIVGCSVDAARRSVNALIDCGMIEKARVGEAKTVKDRIEYSSNQYRLNPERKPDTSIRASGFINIQLKDFAMRFDEMFTLTLTELCDRASLRDHLSKAEYKAIKEFVK